MTDAPVMDLPNGSRHSGGSAFSDLLFADEPTQSGLSDSDFGNEQFQLRGLEGNRLTDAATPLLGLVIRIRRLADFGAVESLYQQVVDEVAAIDRELVEQGYERPTVVAYRYVLCAFIDEAVLGTDWGAHSVLVATLTVVALSQRNLGRRKGFCHPRAHGARAGTLQGHAGVYLPVSLFGL